MIKDKLHEMGCDFDDLLESSKSESSRRAGAYCALLDAAKKVEALLNHLDKDQEEKVIPKDSVVFIKKYMRRVVGVLDNLALYHKNLELVANGTVAGLEKVIEITKKNREPGTRAN